MEYLTFALAKGRLADQTLELFEKIGITMAEMKDKKTRKLIFSNEELKIKMFLSKASDVPTYVEYGAADIGVVGRDTILEGRPASLRSDGSWFWQVPYVCVRSGIGQRTFEASGTDPRRFQISEYCKRLFL